MGSIQNSTYIKALSYGALALITSRFLPGSSSLVGRLGAASLATGITFANDYFIDDQKDWSKTLLKAVLLLGGTTVGANVAVKLLKGRVTLSPAAALTFSTYATLSGALVSLAMKSDPLKRQYDDFKANPNKLNALDNQTFTGLFDKWYSEDFDRFSLIGVDISNIISMYFPDSLEGLAKDTCEKLNDITPAKLGWRRELIVSHLEKWPYIDLELFKKICTINRACLDRGIPPVQLTINSKFAEWLELPDNNQPRLTMIKTIESNPAKHIEFLSSVKIYKAIYKTEESIDMLPKQQIGLLEKVTCDSVMKMDPELLRDWHHLFDQIEENVFGPELFWTSLSKGVQSAFTERFIQSGFPSFRGVTLNDGFIKWFNSLPMAVINKLSNNQLSWIRDQLYTSSRGIDFTRLRALNDANPNMNIPYELSTELLNAIQSDSILFDAVISENPSPDKWTQHGLFRLSPLEQTRLRKLVLEKDHNNLLPLPLNRENISRAIGDRAFCIKLTRQFQNNKSDSDFGLRDNPLSLQLEFRASVKKHEIKATIPYVHSDELVRTLFDNRKTNGDFLTELIQQTLKGNHDGFKRLSDTGYTLLKRLYGKKSWHLSHREIEFITKPDSKTYTFSNKMVLLASKDNAVLNELVKESHCHRNPGILSLSPTAEALIWHLYAHHKQGSGHTDYLLPDPSQRRVGIASFVKVDAL